MNSAYVAAVFRSPLDLESLHLHTVLAVVCSGPQSDVNNKTVTHEQHVTSWMNYLVFNQLDVAGELFYFEG